MSVPLHPQQAPARWDLHSEFVRVAFMLERGVWLDRVCALVLAGTMSWVWLVLRKGDGWGVLGAPVVLGLFLALALGSWKLDRLRDHRVGGPAGPGPSSIGQLTTSASGPDIWLAVHAALAAQGCEGTRFRDSNTVEASLPRVVMVRRFVTVRVEGAGAQGARVTVWAHPEVPRGPWTLLVGYPHDGGAARRTANAILRAIPGGTPLS